MAEFATLEGQSKDIPFNGSGAESTGLHLTNPDSMLSGVLRGTQSVGFGSAKIDGANNRITIGAPDGSSVGIGSIPNSLTSEYGFFALDTTGNLIMKIVGGTIYTYDAVTKINTSQYGKLPDGTTNLVIAKTGNNVADLFV